MEKQVNENGTVEQGTESFWKLVAEDITLWMQFQGTKKLINYSPCYKQTVFSFNYINGETIRIFEGKQYLHFFNSQHGISYSKHIKKDTLDAKTEAEAVYFIIKYLESEVWLPCNMKQLSSYLRKKESEVFCKSCGKTHFVSLFEIDEGSSVECIYCGTSDSILF